MTTAEAIIARLGLVPHPEGGHYRETHRDHPAGGGRGALTVIHYLLRAGERSAWHRIDATEVWHFAAGAPLTLTIADADGRRRVILGRDIQAGEAPHAIVPPFAWQTAESLGAWSLVGCVVAPAFDFAGCELAPAGGAPDLPR